MRPDAAQKLFDRRRSGLDRKAQTLITMAYGKHNVDIGITIIYEFRDEVAVFRSHPLADGKWWASLNELVSAPRIYTVHNDLTKRSIKRVKDLLRT